MKKLISCALLLFSIHSLAQEVLYIGDSHSHIRSQSPEENSKRFGNIFIEGMEARGFNVTYYAACGSAPIGWSRGASTQCGYTMVNDGQFVSVTQSAFPALSEIYFPQVHRKIIINLGDNMFDWKIVNGKRIATLSTTTVERGTRAFLADLAHINETNCAWIGPTYHIEGSNYHKPDSLVDEFYQQLATVLLGKCQIIDSRPMINVTTPNDGLHHTNSDSQAWARGVLTFL